MNDELLKIRNEIDQITRGIVDLLLKRFRLLVDMARIKQHLGMPLFDMKRENEILEAVKAQTGVEPSGPAIQRVTNIILVESLRYMEDGAKKDRHTNSTPIVYSCSGCSSAAQMANHIAIQLDRKNIAEMSCIAGVGGGVKPLVVKARSKRRIVAIDGCPLKCSEHCLRQQGVAPDMHFVLSDYKISKRFHQDFDKNEAAPILEEIATAIGGPQNVDSDRI